MDILTKKIHLSKDVQSALLNFAAGYLAEKPKDPDEYALRFFKESAAYNAKCVQECPTNDLEVNDDCQDAVFKLESKFVKLKGRRNGVCFPHEISEPSRSHSHHLERSEKLKILLLLKKLFPFKTLEEDLLHQIADRMVKVNVSTGDIVVRQGDEYLNWFLIETGTYEEWMTTNSSASLLFRYKSLGNFGNASLVFPHVAPATIVAVTDGTLWALCCAEYKSRVKLYEKKSASLKLACIENWPYIRTLPQDTKEKLVDGIELKIVKKQELVNSGEGGIFYIKSGTVKIKQNDPITGKEVYVNVLKTGESYHELSSFFNRKTESQVVALEPTQILFLGVSSFQRLVGSFTEVVFAAEKDFLQLVKTKKTEQFTVLKELRNVFVKFQNSKCKNFLHFGANYYNDKLVRRYSKLQRNQVTYVALTEERGGGERMRASPVRRTQDENITYTIDKEIPSPKVQRKIESILKSIPIFDCIGYNGIKQLINAMRLVKVYPGHYVMKSGRAGQYFYVIEEGRFKYLVHGEGVTHEIQDCPCYFGELGLIWDGPRYADVLAVGQGKLWALGRASYRKIVLSSKPVKKCLNFNLVRSLAKYVSTIQEVDATAIALAVENLTFKDRELVHSFEQDSCCAYFIQQGTVRVHTDRSTMEHSILERGQGFGNLVFTTEKTKPLQVQSIGKSRVARISVDAFEKLLGHCRRVLHANKCLQRSFTS